VKKDLEPDSINQILASTLNNTIASIIAFVPRFISGFIVLLIGIIIASFLKQILLQIFKFVRFEDQLKRYGVPESKGPDGVKWSNILAELLRWFVIVIFLVPTADIWGLSKFIDVLNNLLTFLPNVFVAVLLLLVGFVISRLVYDLLFASVGGVSKEAAKTVALTGRYAVLVFVILIVLNQLGIASDLIRILFAGFVSMVALAGGIAFGLGGKEVARNILKKFVQKL